jgi:hypothetical protein
MKTLVVGANGATGKHLIEHLLQAGRLVKVIVRPKSAVPDHWNNHQQIEIIRKNIATTSVEELAEIVVDCNSVASCLGHNMTWKGIFGEPRSLVLDAVVQLSIAIEKNAPESPVKFILMNTAGNSNRDVPEQISFAEKMVIGLLRLFLPPQLDNERAADYLRVQVGQQNRFIEWTVVRPDNLIDTEKVSPYTLHFSPIRSAIFDAGTTSRTNVGHFMAELITDEALWFSWKGQMPVIYNVSN